MIRIGILGAAGYTGGELIRLLLNHPEAEIVFANSESNAGNLVSDVHEGLIGETDLKFTDEMPFDQVDVAIMTMSMVCQRSIKRRLPRLSMWPIQAVSLPVSRWRCCPPPI